MYSSVYDAIVTDPVLMLVPVDDHMVHRGDGVFESCKCVAGGVYNLGMHLDRIEQSAAMIGLTLPLSRDALAARMVETMRAGGRRDCAVRLLVSRGPGSFGVNPYDCPSPQVYIGVSRPAPPFMVNHPAGARVRSSRVPGKDPYFARTKNCNYLRNALMKKEAVDAGVDFMAAFDARDCLGEGATENFGIVTADRRLVFPRLEGILEGTTMMRVVALCRADASPARVAGVEFRDIPRAEVRRAAELLIVGTTIDVVSVAEFDGRPVGAGRPGEVGRHLLRLLRDDIEHNAAFRTPVFQDAPEVYT
jgi:branched-chain amino acid aminotransferase